MYTNYYGLRLLPFEDRADPQFTFMTAELEEILAALEYESHYDRGMALVVGEAGVGKTQLIRTLLAQLHTTDHVVVVNRSTGGNLDILRETCKRFGVSLTSGSRDDQQLTRLRRHLTRNAKADHCSVLVVDHAEHLTVDELKQIAALHDLNENTMNLLTVILTGQPRVLQTLKQPGLEQLDQMLFHKLTISALSADETARYINHRLCVAGAVETDIFGADTIAMIHDATGGVPRLINRVCHSAMVAAYGADTRCIPTGIVTEILGGEIIKECTSEATAVPTRGVDTHRASPALRRETEMGPVPSAPTEAVGDWNHDDPIDDMNGSLDPNGYVEHRVYDGGFDNMADGDGYATIDRLQRCMSHAERISATTDAKLAQLSAIEKHLTTLAQSAERLIAGLSQGVRQAGHAFEQIQNRRDATLADAERKISDIDARATRALEVGRNLSGSLVRAETEVDRAKEVSTRLGAFADQLADSVDEMQSRTAPLVDTIHSAEELQYRLEASCQKATETAKQVQAQFQISERKLQDRFIELQQEAQRVTTEAIERIKRTADESVASLTSTIGGAEQRVQDTAEAAQSETQRLTAKGIERIERTVGESVASLTSTISGAEQRAQDAAKALQGEVQRVTTEAVERIERTAGESVASSTSTIGGAEQRALDAAEELQSEAQRVTAEAVERIERTVDESVASSTSAIGGAEQRVQDVAEAVQGEVQRVTTEGIERIERTVGESVASLTSTISGAEQRAQDAAKAVQSEAQRLTAEGIERIERTVSDSVASLTSTISGAEQRAQDAAKSLQSVLESSEPRYENLRGSIEALTERIGNASLQVGHLSETAKSVGDGAQGLVERVTKARDEATPLIARAEQVIDRVKSAHLDAETLRRSFTERLVDIGRACEQTEKLHQQVDTCKQAVDHVLANREWLDNMVNTLSTKVRSAEHCVKTLNGAEARVGEITSAVAAVQRADSDIEKIRSTAEHLIIHADESKRTLAEALAASEDRIRGMSESITSGTAIADRLTELNKVAVELHDATQGLVAHTDEKIGRLDSHSAAAGRILREISQANKQGQLIVDQTATQITKSQELAGAAVDKIERLTEDISSLTTKTETNRKQLAAELAGATEVLDEIRTVAEPARQAAATLAEQVTQAGDVSAVMTEQTTLAQEQLAGLNEITPLLDTIKETGESVRVTAEEIHQVREELMTALEDAAQHATTLGTLNTSASSLIETQCQLAERMENMTRQFDDKIADTKTAMMTGEELLGEFIAQGDTINDRLTQLAQQAEAIGQRVDGLLQQPEAIVAGAKTQSEQLEKVCTAVRKVFAGLSQATLEAREQTDQLRGADNSSTEQLMTLTTRTQQAAATLQEWVEEAVRVQTRLERTLGMCPTIQQTHPRENVAGLGKVVTAPTRSVHTLDGDLAVLGNTGQTSLGASPLAQTNPISSPRAKDIAKMIEEAKRAKTADAT